MYGSSKHKFCEGRSMAFKSLWLFVIIVYTFLDVQSLEQFKRTVEDIKGGGAELLEEKNQLLQAIYNILDCTSKNVYSIRSIYVSVTSFTFTSAFCISNFCFFTQFHILCGVPIGSF
jgi:hypothetical protein